MNSYRFLMIDDSKFTRQLLKEILVKQGHGVVAEFDMGSEAVQGCREFEPDMIILNMPAAEGEGLAMLRQIIDLDPQAAVLVCCSGMQQDVIISAVRMGARGYLLKPFNPEDVQECIEKHAAKREVKLPEESMAQSVKLEPVTPKLAESESIEPEPPEQEEFEESPRYEPADGKYLGPNLSDLSLSDPNSSGLMLSGLEENKPAPARMAIHDIPLAVELDAPKRLTEAVHSDAGISFSQKERRKPRYQFSSVDGDASVMERNSTPVEEAATMPAESEEEAKLEEMEAVQPEAIEAIPVETIQEEPKQEVSLQEASEQEISQEEQLMSEDRNGAEVNQQSEVESEEKEMGNEFSKMNQVLEQIQQMMEQLPAGTRQSMLPLGQDTAVARMAYETEVEAETTVLGFMRLQGDTESQARKRMTRTHMCNWSEDIDGESKQYLVVCTEGENKLNIEMGSLNKKQTLTFSLDGFFELVGWLEETIGRTSISRK